MRAHVYFDVATTINPIATSAIDNRFLPDILSFKSSTPIYAANSTLHSRNATTLATGFRLSAHSNIAKDETPRTPAAIVVPLAPRTSAHICGPRMARATAKKLKLSRTISHAVNDDHPDALRVPRASTTE